MIYLPEYFDDEWRCAKVEITIDDLPKTMGGMMGVAYSASFGLMTSEMLVPKKYVKQLVELKIFADLGETNDIYGKAHYYILDEFGYKLIRKLHKADAANQKYWAANVYGLWDDKPIPQRTVYVQVPKRTIEMPQRKAPAKQKVYKSPEMTAAEAKLAAWNAKVSGKPTA